VYGTTKSPQESLEKAIELTQKAIAQDDGDPYGHAILGWLYCYKREYDKAIAEGERAVALNPSGAMVQVFYAGSLTFAGRPEEAIPLLKKAIRLNPFGPAWYFSTLGNAYRYTGRFEEAVSAYKKALQVSPDSMAVHVNLAATYSMMDREKEARAEVAEVLRVNPKFSLGNWARVASIYKDQSVVDNIIGALRKAGLK
jgi:tetratricopeptide (TPR) repeat protein